MKDAGIRQALVSLRPIAGSPAACELTVSGPVTAHRVGFSVGMIVSAIGGGTGLMAGLGIAVVIGSAPLLPFIAAGGALVGGGTGLKLFRGLYARSMRKARSALEGLVGAVAARAKGVWRGTA